MKETKNARISSTMLGIEDHGIMTCWLNLEYDGSGQAFGGYSLDYYRTNLDGRIGTAWGMEFVKRILETVGVDQWEKLPGKHIRVISENCKVHAIGHIIKELWFEPDVDPALLALKLKLN